LRLYCLQPFNFLAPFRNAAHPTTNEYFQTADFLICYYPRATTCGTARALTAGLRVGSPLAHLRPLPRRENVLIERFEIFRIDIYIGEIKGDLFLPRVHPSDPVRPAAFDRVLFAVIRLERTSPAVFRKYAAEDTGFNIDIEGRAAADRKVGTEHTRKNSADCYRIRGEIATVNQITARDRLFSNVPRRDVIRSMRQKLDRF